MIGFNALVLGLITSNPRPRQALIAAFPNSVHPDAIHKALYELIRAGVVSETEDGIRTAIKAPLRIPDPERALRRRIARETKGEAIRRSQGGERAKYDGKGRRYCTKRGHFAPINQFAKGNSSDGLHPWCKDCKRLDMRDRRASEARPCP